MKKIGILGGMGPDSTLHYYKGIINYFRINSDNLNYPEIIIYSVNIKEAVYFIEKKKDLLSKWLLEKIEALHKAGTDFVAISANTPHIVINKLQEKSPIPVISIIDVTLKYVINGGYTRVGLLGTKTTMISDLYKKPFNDEGIDVYVPEKDDIEIINKLIFSELEIGIIKESSKNILIDIIDKMKQEHSIEAVILGCTELPLLLTKDELGIHFINTTKLHIESIINHCLK